MTQSPVVSVFPIPWEIPAAAGHSTRLVRLDDRDFAGLDGDATTRGLDPRAQLLTAACAGVVQRPVWSGGASDLKEIHGALEARLGPGAVGTFPWPLQPDRDALTYEIRRFAERFGLADLARAEEIHHRDETLRAPLREWEREQGEAPTPPCPARLYRDTLAAITRDGLPGQVSLPRGPRRDAPVVFRLGLLGASELLIDLPEHLERRGARVVMDEWTHACAFLEPSRDLVDRYLRLGLPYGLAARARRMRAFEHPRRLDAWVLITSPFGASNLERVGFPRWLERPMLSLETDARRAMTAADVLRLDAFLCTLQEAR